MFIARLKRGATGQCMIIRGLRGVGKPAMTELGDGPYGSGDVAAQLGRRTSEVSMTRQRLIERDRHRRLWTRQAVTITVGSGLPTIAQIHHPQEALR